MRRHILRVLVTVGLMLVSMEPLLVAQQAPAPGSFLVPEGWTLKAGTQRATITAPEGSARMSVSVYPDGRDAMQVCVNFLKYQMKGGPKIFDVVSKKMFSYSSKELARLEVTVKPHGRAAEREWILGVPVERGTLLIVANMPESSSKKYEPILDRVAKSVLPKYETKWHAVTNDKFDVRLMIAPLWEVDADADGKSDLSPMMITKGDARLSLSSKEDQRGAKEYVENLEKEIKTRSKTYDRLVEEQQPIAGVLGTRLELNRTTTDGVAMREWLVVFSRDNRFYLVKASAPQTHFEQYEADLRNMISSVVAPPHKAN